MNRLAYLHFVRSGYVILHDGALSAMGRSSFGWSRSSSYYPTARYLHFNDPDMAPSDGPNNRWYGLPVRCLVY